MEADAAVWVVRLDGSLTGRVGDLALVLVMPAPGDSSFLAEALGAAAVFLGASSLVDVFLSVALAFSWVGLLGALATMGDLGGLEDALDVVEMVLVLGLVAFGLAFSFSLVPLVPSTLFLELPSSDSTADWLVGSADVSLILTSSSSMTLSGFWLGASSGVLKACLGGDLAGVPCLGDSTRGSLVTLIFEAAFLDTESANTSFLSAKAAGVVLSVSLLCRRLDTDSESPLASRRRPIRPSFSMATKLVRTLESGPGDSDGVGDPGGRITELG